MEEDRNYLAVNNNTESDLGTGFIDIAHIRYSKLTREKLRNRNYKFKILAVDDIELNRKVLKLLLDFFGYTFVVAENGQHAFDMYQETNFDLVLMDIGMWPIDGYETTKLIRDFEKELRKAPAPIIAQTAYGKYVDDKIKEAGLNSRIEKPIISDQLESVLAYFLYDHKFLDELENFTE